LYFVEPTAAAIRIDTLCAIFHQEETLKFITSFCFCVLSVVSLASFAQTKTNPAGHWEGSIAVPSMEIKVVIDLALDAGGQWIGDIDMPDRKVMELPLKGITVNGSAVSFELPGPSVPKFQGKLSEDGNSLNGDFIQAGNTFPFTLKRTGEAKVSIPTKNAELPGQYVGKWEGRLNTPRGNLSTVFNLGNKSGAADGTIDSPEQGAMGIPMNEISVANGSIKITVRIVNGSFVGKLSEDGKVLTGEWAQGGNTLPLVLTKAQ
jgi:hypothetical protein